jgi:hypothetical protein
MSSICSHKAFSRSVTLACIAVAAVFPLLVRAEDPQVSIHKDVSETYLQWQGVDGVVYWLESASDMANWLPQPGVTLGQPDIAASG